MDAKHEKMRVGAFPFLRATYWGWAETILDVCPQFADAHEGHPGEDERAAQELHGRRQLAEQ